MSEHKRAAGRNLSGMTINKRRRLDEPEKETPWGWAGSSVTEISKITLEECLRTCGLHRDSPHPFCAHRYAFNSSKQKSQSKLAAGEHPEDIIEILDTESEKPAALCSKRVCKTNPNCIRYLGQDKWENEENAHKMFTKQVSLGTNPNLDTRLEGSPVGLKNLGATCYANALLQVWYQDRAFRSGVYQCQPSQDKEHTFEESPTFQLQVTFAALQESTCDVFNPSKLVESLQLRTTEQQDAQEFSKLFMSHLDTEFKKQSVPALRSLISDQFEGTQEYGIECSKCHWSSAQSSNFQELEIRFNKACSLKDRLKASLEPEIMDGDNQYRCPQCDSLQDASRYTKIRKLPPVLHFSLLRFVYDVESGERRKSKHSVGYPAVLDMRPFVTKTDPAPPLGGHIIDVDAEDAPPLAQEEEDENEFIYELRGVLLHKGASAYHGHYEAEVFDVKHDSWFQFNDETVSKLNPRGAPVPVTEESDKTTTITKRPQRGQKRQIVESEDDTSDIEVIDGPAVKAKASTSPNKPAEEVLYPLILSKDAYMLVYCRKDLSSTSTLATPPPDLTPPARAFDVIKSLNNAHQQRCNTFDERKKDSKERFEEVRRKVMDIYTSWAVSSGGNALIVSRQALQKWLTESCILGSMSKPTQIPTPPAETTEDATMDLSSTLSLDDIVCEHGKLDPRKAGDMKRISSAACERITRDTNCTFESTLKAEDVCVDCVKSVFTKKAYAHNHPLRVKAVVEELQNDRSFWISKPWLSDWKRTRPDMHVDGLGDPAPDSEHFRADTYCPHGSITADKRHRQTISRQSCEMLQELFLDWEPLEYQAEECPICEIEHSDNKQKEGPRKLMAMEEKIAMRDMQSALMSDAFNRSPIFLLPAAFVRAWKMFVDKPAVNERPTALDNSVFLCEHGRMPFDPNCKGDMTTDMAAVRKPDWEQLVKRYNAGPALELVREGKGNFANWIPTVPLCEECRLRSKCEFDTSDVTLVLLDSTMPLPTAASTNEEPGTLRFSGQKMYGTRSSARLQLHKTRKERITKTTTVLDLKKKISSAWDISPICQRLFYVGKELEENTATIEDLEVQARDTLYVREIEEDEEALNSDAEPMRKKQKREEERGFGGTLLGGGPPSSPTTTPEPVKYSCRACTFENPPDATSCGVCEGKM